MLGSFHLGIFDAERAYMTGPVQKDFDCRLFAQIVRLNMEGIWLSVWMARTAKENARGSSSRSTAVRSEETSPHHTIAGTDRTMKSTDDANEQVRPEELVIINAAVESQDVAAERKHLETQNGQVWDGSQLSEDFEVLGFMGPYIVVRRKSDGLKGSLEFQHNPRFYFNFVHVPKLPSDALERTNHQG